jgi:hypothetical protein
MIGGLITDKRRDALAPVQKHIHNALNIILATLGVLMVSYGSLGTLHAIVNSSLFIIVLGMALALTFSPTKARSFVLHQTLPRQVFVYLYEASLVDIFIDIMKGMQDIVTGVTAACSAVAVMSREDLIRLARALPTEYGGDHLAEKKGLLQYMPAVMQHVLRQPTVPLEDDEANDEREGSRADNDDMLEGHRGRHTALLLALAAENADGEDDIHELDESDEYGEEEGGGQWFAMPEPPLTDTTTLMRRQERVPRVLRPATLARATTGRLRHSRTPAATVRGQLIHAVNNASSDGHTGRPFAFLGPEFEATAASIQAEMLGRWSKVMISAASDASIFIITGGSASDEELCTAACVLGGASLATNATAGRHLTRQIPSFLQPLLMAGAGIASGMLISRSALRAEGRLRHVLTTAWSGLQSVSTSVIRTFANGNAAERYAARVSIAITSLIVLVSWRISNNIQFRRWNWLAAVLWQRLSIGCGIAWKVVCDVVHQLKID